MERKALTVDGQIFDFVKKEKLIGSVSTKFDVESGLYVKNFGTPGDGP